MYVIVKEYRVEEGKEEAFEAAFDPASGPRAELFAMSDDYLGSELLHGDADASRYLAVERWRSQRAYERFAHAHTEELTALERAAVELSKGLRLIGDFTVADEEPPTLHPGGVKRPG